MSRTSLYIAAMVIGLPGIALSTPTTRPRASSSSPAPSASAPSSKRSPPARKTTKPSSKPSPPPKPPSRLPGPIEIGRVHIEVGPERVRITSDITFARGAWEHDDLRVHAAYGAPGVPLAFEASLCSTPKTERVAPLSASCLPLPHETTYRAPSDAAFVVGPAVMAGETVELASEALASLFSVDESQATLRLRQIRPLPAAAASGEREVLIRLGQARGVPYRVGSIEIAASEGVVLRHIEARLCGTEIEVLPVASTASGGAAVTTPVVPRTGHEDLCVRFAF